MKTEIKIDTESLIMALEDHNYSFDYYLDLKNGKVVMLTRDMFDEELDDPVDLDGYNRELVENNPDRFIYIEPIESHESFGIMENFTLTLADDIIKRKLSIALSKPKPFRNFKDELYNYPEVQKDWYKFYEDEMTKIAYMWLESNNIIAELIHNNFQLRDKN